ncbi:MAG: T9SS type A sorting domain-containing protein [Bacteroidales bacterium]|nr:T9SS type A sorting domain-containing protein [Bacteroidales bacterium]
MIRKTFLFTALTLVCVSIMAQSTFGITGGDVRGANGSMSYTMGQPAVMTAYSKVTNASAKAANLREGVQQTYTIEELKIDGVQVLNFDVSVYPNPTADKITVSIGNDVQDMSYELYSIDGKLLKKGRFQGTEQNIEMKDYVSGSYVLRLSVGRSENSYRIVKM